VLPVLDARHARAGEGSGGRGYGFGSVARMNPLVSAATVSSRRFAGAYASPPAALTHPGDQIVASEAR